MKPPSKMRYRIFAPLIYLAALLLLLEDWLWDVGARLIGFIVAWPPLHALETRIRALPPYAALAAFALPAILLLPVKLLALLAIAGGHPFSGVAVIVAAKLGGAALVARLYTLCKPALLSLPWFARWHGKFMALKELWIGRLRATAAYRRILVLAATMRAALRALLAAMRPRKPLGGRHGMRPARLLRRFIAMWRARRR